MKSVYRSIDIVRRQQFCHGHVKSLRQLLSSCQGDVALASLDGTDSGPVQSRDLDQRLLRPTARDSQQANREIWGRSNNPSNGPQSLEENILPVKRKTASGVFTWDTRLHQGKIVRKLSIVLEKTERGTTKGVREGVPGPVL